MSIWQYKDASRSELWEILQIQLEETQRLTAELDDLQTFFDTCYEELQATRSAHDKIEKEHDELLNNQAKRDLLMKVEGVKELISSVGACQGPKSVGCYLDYDMVIDELNKLTKQAEGEL